MGQGDRGLGLGTQVHLQLPFSELDPFLGAGSDLGEWTTWLRKRSMAPSRPLHRISHAASQNT